MTTEVSTALPPKVYSAYRKLKMELGRLDAAAELAELGLRCLTESAPGGKEFSDWINSAASRHGLHVNVSTTREAHRVLALSAITNAQSAYENFLGDIAIEARTFIGINIDMGKRKQDVTKHDHFVECIKSLGYKPNTQHFAFLELIIAYFHLVRTSHVHKGADLVRRINAARNRVLNDSTWGSIFPKRRTLPELADLGFEEFLVFTQAVRLIAKYFAELLIPDDNALFHHPEVVRFREAFNTEPKRLGLFLRDRFALDDRAVLRIRKLLDGTVV